MIRAIGKHVIVKAVYPETKDKIILTAKEPIPTHYMVISVGDDVKEFREGAKIPHPIYTNQMIEHEGQKYFVINLENIHSIFI